MRRGAPDAASLCAVALLLLGSGVVWAGLPGAADLAADGREAARRGVPVLLVITREGCEFCAQLEETVLGPMVLAGDHPERVLIREINLDARETITDFDGGPTSCWALADGYDMLFSPTVLLVGPRGQLLVEPIIGINTPEMYGWYLDQAIEAATRRLAAP